MASSPSAMNLAIQDALGMYEVVEECGPPAVACPALAEGRSGNSSCREALDPRAAAEPKG